MKPLNIFASMFVVTNLFTALAWAERRDLKIEQINLPAGFHIEVFADNIPNARGMAFGDKGTLFVGSMQAGNVYAVLDPDQDGHADEVRMIAKGLKMPVGVAFFEGDLYVSAIHEILRFDDIETHLENPPRPVVIYQDLPRDVGHGWKFIKVGPDRKLYVPIGAPCNVCEEDDPRYATISRMNPDGTDFDTFANGIRNSVGFDWHPDTRELWFTDNGRDWMGDHTPPDELNRAPHPGLHFGFPYCHGNFISDPQFGKNRNCDEFQSPAQELGPHVASLGMRFYTGRMFPDEYRHQIFIAEHGSWNRSTPLGYRVMLVRLRGNEAISYEVFAEGWLESSGAWGRPADIEIAPDGSLLVSDDDAGAIYRIYYKV